jgi:hypothetical protein
VREKWLARLWDAIQEDKIPYLEYLMDFWGELCVTRELASTWADRLVPTMEAVWDRQGAGGEF